MADIQVLTNDLGAYEGTSLLTNSQSIIKAINELYVNQQILFATSANLFQKINLSLGDLASDDTLRESYIQLRFSSVFDGLVKLEKALNEGITSGNINTLTKINEIKELIGNLDSDKDLQEVFTAMGWKTVCDALVKVDERITTFINNSTSNVTAISVNLRNDINDLKSIVGTVDTASRDRVAFGNTNFTNILAAVVALNNLVGYNTAAKEEFDQTTFESMLDMLIETYNSTANITDTLNKITDAEASQAAVIAAKLEKYSKNLEHMNSTITTLVNDFTLIENELQSQYDYLKTGFENILISLQKLATSNASVVAMVGSISENADVQNEFDAAGYTSLVDGICKLSVTTNSMVDVLGNVDTDSDLRAAWTATGYDNIISAVIEINNLLGNLATNNILKASFKRLGFSNVAEGLVQLSDSLENQVVSINTLRSEIITHEIDPNAHSDIIPAFLMYHSNKVYVVGERVYVKNFPNYLCLECIEGGTTGSEQPDFDGYLAVFKNQTN